VSTFCNQQEFAKDHRYVDWPEGASRISYTDITHVKDGEWYDLVSVDIGQQATPGDRRERSFRLTLGLDKKFSTLSEDGKDVKDKKERYSSVITDTVALSATRLGLLSPLISGKTAAQLLELRSTKCPSTNMLSPRNRL
jgi:hypothetical protein